MKTFTCLLLFAIVSFSEGYATIRTVDNNPNHNAQYNTINAAINASTTGDTVLVQGSATSYSSVTVNRRIALIGTGHHNNANATGRVAINGGISISTGVNGVLIEGIYSNGITISGSQHTVRNCNSGSIGFSGTVNDVLIIGCVFRGMSTSFSNNQTNIEFRNNHITLITSGQVGMSGGASESVFFKNNLIYHATGGTASLFSITSNSLIFLDNVFFFYPLITFNPWACINCIWQNNLTYSPNGQMAELPNTDMNNLPPTWQLNEQGQVSPVFSVDFNYNMLEGLPATSGFGGGQIGIFGGGYLFRLNGRPQGLPRVTSTVITTPIVAPGGTVNVQFSAESDN